MDIIQELLITYQLPAIFLGAFFFGETVILSAAFLAGQGLWSVWNVFVLAFAGTMISDSLWFVFGLSIFKFAHQWKHTKNKYEKLIKKLDTMTGRKSFFALLFIKFLYGTRILTILYLSVKRIKFRTFLVYNSIGTVLWLLVMISIGWFAGKGFSNLMPYVRKGEYAIAAIVLMVIAFRSLSVWMEEKIIEE